MRDARYEKVRHIGSVISCAVLLAMGVREEDCKRMLLGVSVSLSEAEVHWRAFLEGLRRRGLEVTKLVTSDDHAGLRAARRAVFPILPWQRCQFHLQQNAQHYVPNIALRPQVVRDLRSVFNRTECAEASERLAKLVEKYQRPAPKLAEWMETNVPEGFAVFALPEPHRRRRRTTNAIERLNRELHRLTRVANSLPNEASLLRLGDGLRDQRGLGDRTNLLEPGERMRTPAQPLLQKKSCFIDGLTTEEYEQYYLRYEDDLAADLGGSVPLVLGVIGRLDQPANHYSFEMVEPVRRALRELVGMRPQILARPETVNCQMTNRIHFD